MVSEMPPSRVRQDHGCATFSSDYACLCYVISFYLNQRASRLSPGFAFVWVHESVCLLSLGFFVEWK